MPTFILMSFVLTHDFFLEHDICKVKNRFCRLLIPQIGWSIIYWMVYKIIGVFFEVSSKQSISDLLWQIFTGSSPKLNATMWYQVDLIFLTLLFLLTIYVFKKHYMLLFYIYAIVSIYAQYSGLNLFFMKYREEIRFPAGRFCEVLPIAVLGFAMAEIGFLEKFNNNYIKINIYVLCIPLLLMISKFHIFVQIQGFYYSGIDQCVVAFLLISIFYIFPCERLPDWICVILRTISKYTMGIYCMHRLVYSIFTGIVTRLGLNIQTDTIMYCIVIYLLCYMISFMMAKAFKGKFKMLVV